MSQNTITLNLDEYLELKKLKEDAILNHTYLVSCGYDERITHYHIMTKNKALKRLIAENNHLAETVEKLDDRIFELTKKKWWQR